MGFIILVFAFLFLIMMIKYINLSEKYDKKKLENINLITLHNALLKEANRRIRHLNNDVRALSTRDKDQSVDLDKSLIKELIMFCHPDKHKGSEKASRLTQKLIKVRDDNE